MAKNHHRRDCILMQTLDHALMAEEAAAFGEVLEAWISLADKRAETALVKNDPWRFAS